MNSLRTIYKLIITQLELKYSLEENPDWGLKNDLTVAYISRSRIYAKGNEVEKAFADLNRAIEINPAPHVYVIRSRAFKWNKLYYEAIADIDQAMKIDPEDASLYLERGNLLLTMEKHEEALKDFEFALQSGMIRPTDFIERKIKEIKEIIRQNQEKPD